MLGTNLANFGCRRDSLCVCLQVSVNGQHFLHYRYRLPLSRVDTLGIFGDILVKAVGFLNINVSSFGAEAWVTVAADVPWYLDRPGAPSYLQQALSH